MIAPHIRFEVQPGEQISDDLDKSLNGQNIAPMQLAQPFSLHQRTFYC
jgi:hypothetical protein